jgi:hypothetical protein
MSRVWMIALAFVSAMLLAACEPPDEAETDTPAMQEEPSGGMEGGTEPAPPATVDLSGLVPPNERIGTEISGLVAAGGKRLLRRGAASRNAHSGKANDGLDFVEPSALVCNFRLDPERSEIVTGEQRAVEPVFMIDFDLAVASRDGWRGTKCVGDVLDNHRAEIAPDIPGAVARDCRRREHG